MSNKQIVIRVLVLLMVVFAIASLFSACTTTKYGTVKAVKQFGGLTGAVFTEGLNFKIPWIQGTEEYPITVTSYETSSNPAESLANFTDYFIDAQTSNGQQIEVKYTVLFRIAPEDVVWIARNIGEMDDVVENIIKAHSRNEARKLAQNYAAEDLYSGPGIQDYEKDVATVLTETYTHSRITLEDFLVRKISFDTDYVQSIENKQIALENIATAEHAKDARIKDAEGEAKSVELAADAEAYSINARGAALEAHPGLTQWEFIQKLSTINWMMLDADTVTPLLPIPELNQAK